MKVKKYIANDYQEALRMIKAEMGSNAVILHQNRIKEKGLKGLFKKSKVEVVAAVEDFPPMTVKETVTKKDINELKNLIKNMTTYKNGHDTQEQEKTVVYKLINYGIEKEVTQLLSDGIDDLDNNGIKILKQRIEAFVGPPQKLNTEKNKKILFVGPTGVGKTTTIAKIASNLILNENKKVMLLTADIFRIAAVEQLKTYGEILGAPVKIVNNIFELHRLQPEFEKYDVVLIDTAGRSHKDETRINELKTFIKYANCDEIYLCLSATTKSEDLKEVIRKYEFVGNYKLLFTKLDETDNYSSILNAIYYSGRPISYFTIGQIVPDDITLAESDIIVSSIVKGN
ncbi:MAG TPA: AAA family ATPase [Clostridia bacterium]|nr:AAA family ATPase [Clostridia bacterium]